MTTIPPIQSSYPVQAAYPPPFANEEIPPEIAEHIDKEIETLLAIVLRFDDHHLINGVLRCTLLKSYLNHMASPQFWKENRGMQVSQEFVNNCPTPFLQLSKIETYEATLIELKRLQDLRILIRTKEFLAIPHLPNGYLIPEQRSMKELERILISAINREINPQRKECFALTRSPSLNAHEMLFYQKSGAEYQAHLIRKKGTHPLSAAYSTDNVYKTNRLRADANHHPLFLDENNQPIRGKAISFYTQAVAMRGAVLAGDLVTLETLVSYHLNLGSAEEAMVLSFAVGKDAQGKSVCEYIPSQSMFLLQQKYPAKIFQALEAKMAQESMALVSAFQQQTPEALAENQCILLACPTSQRDWDYLNQQLLLSLIRNIESKESSEEEREQSLYLLQYYINQVELELPAQEGEEGETREMTPKAAVVEILKLLPKEEPVEKLDPRLLERDRQRAHPFKPKGKKALAAAEGEAKEEPPPAAEPALLLTDRQKEVIEEIYYDGKPLKAKAFLDFMRALLGQQEGVWFSQNGSHLTAHRKGKVSVTLVRPHGRDATARGSLKHQRNVLRQLMGWDLSNNRYLDL